MSSSIIVLIAGAVEAINKMTAKRIYHALINHGVSCEMLNMVNSWHQADKFTQNYQKRQKLGELSQVVIVSNHPIMQKTAKMDACRSFWGDATILPTLSICLLPETDYYKTRWCDQDDNEKFVINHLIPTYNNMPIVCFGAGHHRSYRVRDELSLLFAAGGAVKAIHEILRRVNNEQS